MNFKGVIAGRQLYFKLPMGDEVVFPEWKPGYLNRLLLVIPEIDMARDRLVGIPFRNDPLDGGGLGGKR